jgi:hypothetical protein
MAFFLDSQNEIDRTRPDYLHRYHADVNQQLFGSFNITAEQLLIGYLRHKDEVVSYFSDRPNQLLILDIPPGERWRPLCRFLGVPEPRLAFPCLHSTAEAVSWRRNCLEAWQTITNLIDQSELFILIDECQLKFAMHYHFLEKDGWYNGVPASDEIAIAELERMRRNGATYRYSTHRCVIDRIGSLGSGLNHR